ncbi:unnamed protein product [Effrenium voratum]|nr:unnamed protein product [Effrenium voratum]
MHVHPHVAISGVAKEVSIPLIALLLGALSRPVPQLRTASLLMIYFGAQTGIMLLAKSIISSAIVSHELDLHGLPAAFLMTAVHQVTTFALFGGAFFVSRFTPWPHIPQPLTSWLEVRLILAFSASFAANIGLNNFSFQFLPLSLNLVIRSCLPIATAFVQALRPHKGSEPVKGTTLQELMYMVLGVICAVVGVVAQTKAVAKAGGEHLVPRNMGLGVIVCVLSLFAGALNMVLASEMGKTIKLETLDMCYYMALPSALMLAIPGIMLSHPSWPGQPSMTDLQVFHHVWEWSPGVLGLAWMLGVCASGYNVLQYSMAQSLSATYTTFAGNFNKAFTVVISLAAGLEQLPEGAWGIIMLLATVGNILSFTGYSVLQLQR